MMKREIKYESKSFYDFLCKFMCRENPYNELFYTMLNSTERIANQFQHICIQKVKHLVGLEIKIINSFAVHVMIAIISKIAILNTQYSIS